REQKPAVAADDARVVARDEPLCAGAAGEREQLGEPERPVAADTRIGRLTAAERAHELGDHRSPELLAEVERHVREAPWVARLARRDHGLGRAAGALRV